MISSDLLSLIEEVVGSTGKRLNKGEVIFYCPFCSHYKPKLSIQLNRNHINKNGKNIFGSWKCWVCGETGGTKGKSLRSLFRKLNASKEHYIELSRLCDDDLLISTRPEISILGQVELPKEFIPLWKPVNSIFGKHAISYLNTRGVFFDDFVRFYLGFCEEGRYKNRIIIPSYNKDGKLNYFTARAFYDNPYSYINPPISKDIVGFELFTNFSEDIIIVEGCFDAIKVKRNTIPLFGKTIGDALLGRLLRHKGRVILYLDGDALRNSISIAKILLANDVDTYICRPPIDNDPGDLNMETNWKIISNAKKINFKRIIELQLGVG